MGLVLPRILARERVDLVPYAPSRFRVHSRGASLDFLLFFALILWFGQNLIEVFDVAGDLNSAHKSGIRGALELGRVEISILDFGELLLEDGVGEQFVRAGAGFGGQL